MNIILASASKRRSDLMKLMGLEFEIVPSMVSEDTDISDPEAQVVELARRKARSVLNSRTDDCLVVGSDTLVCLDGDVLGKPRDEADAFNMLRRMSGRTHVVYTGLAVLSRESELFCCDSAQVTFDKLSDNEIKDYISTGEPMDKAGSYGLQGGFCVFVPRICGSYFTVVGLPVHKLYTMLKSLGAI